MSFLGGGFGNVIGFGNIEDYVLNDGPNSDSVSISFGILANGEAVTGVYVDHVTGVGDDLYIYFGGFDWNASYAVSGSTAVDLSGIGHTFGQFNIGTHEDGSKSLIVEYSFVPDTGTTAALLGVGGFVLAFPRRRPGKCFKLQKASGQQFFLGAVDKG